MSDQPNLEDRMKKVLTRIAQVNSCLTDQERERREVRMMGYLTNIYGEELAGKYFEHYAGVET